MIKKKVKIGFILFAVFTFLVRLIFKTSQSLVEEVYSNTIFQGVRWLIDHTIHHINVPLIFVFLFFGIGYLLIIISRLFRRSSSIKDRLKKFSFSFVSFLTLLYGLFMWLWGFNYLRIPIEDKMQFSIQGVSPAALKEKLIERLPALMEARSMIQNNNDATALSEQHIPDDFENKIRDYVTSGLRDNKYKASTNVQARFLPKGTLLRIKTAGIYFPFVGESNIDAGLHPLQYSETLAHEFAHAYGFGDEGTCSFVAYLSLQDAKEPFIQYSLLLSYWRTLARNYLRYNYKDYQEFRLTLPQELVNDLDAIAENRKKYPAIFPNAKNVIYDSYLKAQGIKEGLLNYNRVIMLVESYENSLDTQ